MSQANAKPLPTLTLSALLFATALPALAGGGLQVSPVRLNFDADQHGKALQLSNGGSQTFEAQVRVMRWTQEGGKDRLLPADEIVASPAILRVAPGEPQTVRLVRVRSGPTEREQSFRVLVDELPGAQRAAAGPGLKMLMRYSIPVFVAPAAAAGPRVPRVPADPLTPTDISRVSARLLPAGEGRTELRVHNEGARALRISQLSSQRASGARQSLGEGLIGYVLPGQQMSWPLNLAQPLPADLSLKARFNDDREARALPLGGPGR